MGKNMLEFVDLMLKSNLQGFSSPHRGRSVPPINDTISQYKQWQNLWQLWW